MGDTVTIPREEWERLLNEVKELRRTVDEVVTTLKPLLYVIEKLPNLMADMEFFKTIAPLLALPHAMGRSNVNVITSAMSSGLECTSKALEKLQSSEPEFSISRVLFDKETRRALGILLEFISATMPCLHEQLRQSKPE
jgi:uncharacterized protein YjgD (DUF1641 family)